MSVWLDILGLGMEIVNDSPWSSFPSKSRYQSHISNQSSSRDQSRSSAGCPNDHPPCHQLAEIRRIPSTDPHRFLVCSNSEETAHRDRSCDFRRKKNKQFPFALHQTGNFTNSKEEDNTMKTRRWWIVHLPWVYEWRHWSQQTGLWAGWQIDSY